MVLHQVVLSEWLTYNLVDDQKRFKANMMHRVIRNTLLITVVALSVTMIDIVVGHITDPAPLPNASRSDRPNTDVVILHVAVDTDNSIVYVWVKNVGEADITAIDSSRVFYKSSTRFDNLPYNSSPCYDCWTYAIEDYSLWEPKVTVKVTVHLNTLASGNYVVRFVTPTGAIAEKEFTV